MVNIVTTPEWKSVRILEQEELALGGENGNMNEQAVALVARSEFLKQRAAYQYNTLAEANADIANIALNQNVNVVDSGLYKKDTAGATSLTKSPHDPVEQAKNYTDTFLPVLDSVSLNVGADANSLIDNGKYIIVSSGSYPNFPLSSYGELNVVSRGQTVTQTFHSTINNRYFYRTRYAGAWTEWKEAQSKVEIEALISAAIAGLNISKISTAAPSASNIIDANNLTTNETLIINNANSAYVLNLPYNSYGVISVISGGRTVTQFFHTTVSNRLCFRTRYDGVWNEWQELRSKIQIEALISAAVNGLRINRITQPAITVDNKFDANTIITDQTVIINTSAAENLLNLPYTTQSVLTANATLNGSIVTQVLHTTNQNRLCWRSYHSGSWREWKEAQSKVEIEALLLTNLNTSKAYTDLAIVSASGVEGFVNKGLLSLSKGGQVVDVNAKENITAFFGSSTIWYIQDQLETLFSSYGYTTNIKGGQGGEYIENTGARFGSFDCMINPVTIPASGAVNVVSNMPVVTALKAFSGTLGGVQGTLSYSAANTSLVFTRTTSGSEIVLPSATQFTPDVDKNMYGGILIINVGKNNLTNSSPSINNVDAVFNKTVDFVNKMSNVFKRVLILDNFVNTDSSQFDSATRINQYNAKLYEKYDGLTIRTKEYITSAQVWIDTGITPTSTDLEQQSRGEKPTSLSRDSGHLNVAAEAALIENVIKPKLEVFQWI